MALPTVKSLDIIISSAIPTCTVDGRALQRGVPLGESHAAQEGVQGGARQGAPLPHPHRRRVILTGFIR